MPPRRSDGTIQHRRKMQPWPKDRPFRILSIDGGGICGLLPASILAELERRFLGGESISHHFDLVAGTSTGGLIALGLGAGMTGDQLRHFYVTRGPFIFPASKGVAGAVRGFWKWGKQKVRTAYDVKPLETELMEVFGQRFFGDSKLRLCVPSFEGRHGEPWIFKTPHHPDYKNDRNERMFTVGRATSAAPTYFRPLDAFGYRMVDGGLWANNPVMIGLVDALACFEIDREQVQILTLGCGETSFQVSDSQATGGELQWRNAIRGAMRAQSHNALGQAFLLVGKDSVVRLDAPETPNPIAMDDVDRALAELPNMARSLVEGAGHRINELFLHDKVAPYQPIPM
ncbi:CBASS cGAMP-activated phospholipase [Rhodoblastus acidophilus]|uniref:CBASS cGAMP-activated phospholipase n=1 Tax=Rhodoblastus acidophilus TaxID=1074 RepID=UPI0029CABB28|nr:CBASS cGAMP-activated phospholipase [Rhodoblastus acidophilus]